MNIVKASALTSISTVIKVISGIIINKAISTFVGPSGLAVVGQFQNASVIIQIIASGGISNGVVKYTAENEDSKKLWSTALKLTLYSSVVVSLILFVFSEKLSIIFFSQPRFYFVFAIFALTLVFFSINQLLLNVISGLGDVKSYTLINIIQSIYSLIFTTALIVFFNINGALIAMVTNQSVVLIFVLWKLRNNKKIIFGDFLGSYCKDHAKKLLKYSAMSFFAAISLPISLMIIRNYIGANLSWDYAGYWQAMNYISTMYLMIITTVLSVYYLPKLSSINKKKDLVIEIRKTSFFLVPLAIILASSIYLLKAFIVFFMFNSDFNAMLVLFKWQLIGDVIKVSACLLSYIMLAKAMTKTFIITEILSAISLAFFSILFAKIYGFVGLSYAYSISNLLYFFIILAVICFYFKSSEV